MGEQLGKDSALETAVGAFLEIGRERNAQDFLT